MTIAYPVARDGIHLHAGDGELIGKTFDRLTAALNYTQDLTDAQLTEDSAGTVRDDRDRLLAALRELRSAIKAQPGGCGEALAECLRRADFAAIKGR